MSGAEGSMGHPAAIPPMRRIPLLPGIVVAGFVALFAFIVLHGPPAPNPPQGTVVAARDIFVDDRDDGAIVIRDARSGQVVQEYEPGTGGFIRATLRGLARARRLGELGPEKPFRVTRWSEGRLTLEDTASGRVVDLLAFGQAQVDAFQSLLNHAGGEGG